MSNDTAVQSEDLKAEQWDEFVQASLKAQQTLKLEDGLAAKRALEVFMEVAP